MGLPNALSIVLMTVTSLPLLFLYVWMVLISFSDGMAGGITPKGFTLQNWSFLWSNFEVNGFKYPNIWHVFGNSFLIAAGTSIIEVTASLMAGYVLSRGNFPGSKFFLLQSTLLTHAFPAITGLIAAFYILKSVGLLNTLIGIVLLKLLPESGCRHGSLKVFFDEVPKQLEWAASIDGSGRLKAFFSNLYSNVWPGIVAISLFAFLSGWGEYVMVSVFIFDDRFYTLSIILRGLFTQEFTGSYGIVMALAVFYMIPCLILYLFSQQALMKMKM